MTVVAIAGLLAVLAVACGSSSKNSNSSGTASTAKNATSNQTIAATGQPKTGGSITVGLEAEDSGYNPASPTTRWDISGTEVGLAIYDPMVAFDAQGQWKPYLAQSITPNADYTKWTATMRPNITFQNGEPLTGAAVATAYKAFKASTLSGPVFADVDDIKATGPLTMEFDMKTPWVAFPNSLASQVGMIPAPSMFGPDGTPTEASNNHPIGTGPFSFVTWQQNDHLTVKKYDKYWRKDSNGTQLPYLDGITFKPITDHNTRDAAMIAGNLDVEQTDTATSIVRFRQLASQGKLQLVEDDSTGEESDFVIVNTQDPAMTQDVRTAMAYATNRDLINKVINDGILPDANGPWKSTSPWYAPTNYPNYDLAKAKDLVQKYTQQHGHPPTFTLGSTTEPDVEREVQLLQQMWQAAGMKVTLKNTLQDQFIADAVTGKYQANLWRQFGAVDPDTDALWWYSANAPGNGKLNLNIAQNKDAQIDAALDKGRQSTNLADRKAAYATLQQRFATLIPYVWLQHVIWVIVAGNDMRGLTNGPLPDGEASLPIGGGGDFGGVIRWTQMWKT
jgi:4-phytase/acid phosphatase/peptide/nickel transport system substrate-binding protein